MGKQCSCLSAPKENVSSRSRHCNITKDINTQTRHTEFYDDSLSQQVEEKDDECVEDQYQMAKLLTHGYIRSLSNLNDKEIVNITKSIETYYYTEIPIIRKRCVFLSIYSLNNYSSNLSNDLFV